MYWSTNDQEAAEVPRRTKVPEIGEDGSRNVREMDAAFDKRIDSKVC